jgi:hypothetical protein
MEIIIGNVTLFQNDSSSMKSLKELAKLAVLKQRCGNEECVPVTLREELRCMEEAIRADMTGCGYQECSSGSSHEFDILYCGGCWSFLLRRQEENRWTEMSMEIRAQSQSILEPEWADLFGIDYMRARQQGLRISDSQLDLDERRVTFNGHYGPPIDDIPQNQFSVEMRFSEGSSYVMIKTLEWDHGTCSHFPVTERLYKQTDTNSWGSMQWDDELREFYFPLSTS